MKTLLNLSATAAETDFREPPVHHHNVGDIHAVETTDGRKGVYSRHLRVGPAGIIFSDGKTAVVIPNAELWKLVEQHEPALRVPAKVIVPAAAGKPSTPNS